MRARRGQKGDSARSPTFLWDVPKIIIAEVKGEHMILYVDKTKDSEEAVELLMHLFPTMVIAPSTGRGLPEFVHKGISYVGIRAIREFLAGRKAMTGA